MDFRALESKKTLLNHFKALRKAWADDEGSNVFLDCKNFIVHIEQEGKSYTLYPQFAARYDNQKVQTLDFNDDVGRFFGWRPYSFRHVPLLANKIKFKKFLRQHQIQTPDYITDSSELSDVILKNNLTSYGDLIRGPFKSSLECHFKMAQGDFFEKFIMGTIVKIWYWNHQPVCMELQGMPRVTGNSYASIRDLVELHLNLIDAQPNWEQIAEVLAYFDRDLDTILAKDEIQLVDFRYASPLSKPRSTIELPCDEAHTSKLLPQLIKLGQLLWEEVVHEHFDQLVYTIDAILTDDEQLWILEANANPFIHPQLYPVMAEHLKNSQQEIANMESK